MYFIHHNDELGIPLYSITPEDDPENWINSLDSLEECAQWIKNGAVFNKHILCTISACTKCSGLEIQCVDGKYQVVKKAT